MGGIWRIKLRRWCEVSRYAWSVVSLLEGCDLSFQRTRELVGGQGESREITAFCTPWSAPETAPPGIQPTYAPVWPIVVLRDLPPACFLSLSMFVKCSRKARATFVISKYDIKALTYTTTLAILCFHQRKLHTGVIYHEDISAGKPRCDCLKSRDHSLVMFICLRSHLVSAGDSAVGAQGGTNRAGGAQFWCPNYLSRQKVYLQPKYSIVLPVAGRSAGT